ncbi:chromate efflux transporter [Pannonibacter tanglangensis]|uniref:Chromate efflux transporter n=1 Tax=Pannonibacter tanglangensis TaxID=2750084 RepID=A0ABW9ZE17_9HYPH|nr:chromate efflux transporter [Pannonibacter sp. XCT-34]NBN62278.1 chromate efflux transporter [Pannonibacter sp. XCT-34]
MSQTAAPSFRDLVTTFARIGILSFGGAAGQIAMMHRIVVDEKKWLDEPRYLHALNYCMLLPGPEAQQLATYIGWLTHGVRGGLAAGILFVLPGSLIMLALSFLYVLGTGTTLVDGIFLGIKAAVLAIVIQALIKIAKRGLKGPLPYVLAATAFLLIFFLDLPFPLIILGAGVAGAVAARLAPQLMGQAAGAGGTEPAAPLPEHATRKAVLAALACLSLWWAPVLLAGLVLGFQHVLVDIGLFFSKLAVITFGGAYAVLAYLAQAGVDMGWVTPPQMIDGLGLAETTPGPTILVNQFVGFLAALREPGSLSPLVVASLGAGMATWVTFAPSFLWIFAGAPFVERLRRNAMLAAALTGITAAVVGVIAYVAVWFGLNVLFASASRTSYGWLHGLHIDPASLDGPAAALTGLALVLVFAARRGILETVALMALLGTGIRMVMA